MDAVCGGRVRGGVRVVLPLKSGVLVEKSVNVVVVVVEGSGALVDGLPFFGEDVVNFLWEHGKGAVGALEEYELVAFGVTETLKGPG